MNSLLLKQMQQAVYDVRYHELCMRGMHGMKLQEEAHTHLLKCLKFRGNVNVLLVLSFLNFILFCLWSYVVNGSG